MADRSARVIVASTRASAGVYEDRCGPIIAEWLAQHKFSSVQPVVVSDGEPVLPTGSDGARADASVALTPAGEEAATQLRTAREAGIDRLVTEWQPDQVPELRQLIGQITTTLVATDPAPEHDAVGAPAARPAP